MLYKSMSKAYLAGEYAILKKGGLSVILPIEKYTYLDITKSDKTIIISQVEDKDNLISASINVAFSFAKRYENFKYVYTSELYRNGIKLGLGSSASVVVVTIKAILSELNVDFSLDDLFKLSVKAMLASNQKGSMGDIACIVYENLIVYKSLDKKTFEYEVRCLKPKKGLLVSLIHTNMISLTGLQIENIDTESKEFKIFFDRSNKLVTQYIKAIENADKLKLEKSIKDLSENLSYLEKNTKNLVIYNEKIKSLLKDNMNCKISGSGNGDFVVCIDFLEEEKIKVNILI